MGNSRALLVEDDLRVREVLAAYLQVDGWEVTEAADGLEGLACAEAAPPDLIVTDIMMPRMDGLTMVRRLRGVDGLAEVPVLLISGHADPPLDRDVHSGPWAYLAKPVSLGGFLAAIRQLRGQRA